MTPFLPQWPSEPERLRTYSSESFRAVAPRYDRFRAMLSFGMEHRWKRRALRRVLTGTYRRHLDLATGTGDFLDAVPEPTLSVAMDLSEEMLRLAVAAGRTKNSCVVRADLNELPFSEGGFDLITIGYGVRYARSLPQLLEACASLLAPGGTLFAFDLARPRSKLVFRAYLAYLITAGTLLGVVLHGNYRTYWHLAESVSAFGTPEEFRHAAVRAGFGDVRLAKVGGGLVFGLAARKPN